MPLPTHAHTHTHYQHQYSVLNFDYSMSVNEGKSRRQTRQKRLPCLATLKGGNIHSQGVFILFDGGGVFAVLRRRRGARHPPVRRVFFPPLPVRSLISSVFHGSTEKKRRAIRRASSHREEPFMFPSASTAVDISSSSHCQQSHPPHPSSLWALCHFAPPGAH